MAETLSPPEITTADVAKGAGTTLLARLGGVLEVVAQPLYIWLFGLAGYGFYGALWAAINLTQNVADLGTTGAMQRVIPQAQTPEGEAKALRAALLLGVVPCILIAIAVFLLAEPVSKFFNADAADSAQAAGTIRLFVWALPLWSFVEVATSALRSRRVFGAEIRLRLFLGAVDPSARCGGIVRWRLVDTSAVHRPSDLARCGVPAVCSAARTQFRSAVDAQWSALRRYVCGDIEGRVRSITNQYRAAIVWRRSGDCLERDIAGGERGDCHQPLYRRAQDFEHCPAGAHCLCLCARPACLGAFDWR